MFATCLVIPAYAEDEFTEAKVFAVQSRGSFYSDEITVGAAYLPLDSFNRYVAAGFSYTHRFTGFSAWEAVDAYKAWNSTSGLKEQIQSAYNVTPAKFNTLDYEVTTNYVYTPFYSKNLIWGQSVVMSETSLLLGGGIAKFDAGFVNCADVGLVFKYALGNDNTLNFDFRYIFYVSADARDNLSLAVTYTIPFGSKQERVHDETE